MIFYDWIKFDNQNGKRQSYDDFGGWNYYDTSDSSIEWWDRSLPWYFWLLSGGNMKKVAKWISLDSSREKHQILILQHSWSGEVWKLYWSTLSAHILSPLKSLFWEWSWKVSHIIYFNWCQIGFGFSASIVIRKGQPNALVATKGPQIKPVVGFEILMSVCSTFVPNSDL